MADCGIDDYDRLPAVVEWIDVDMLRWHLTTFTKPYKIWSVPYAGPFLQFLMRPNMDRERVIFLLETAKFMHEYKLRESEWKARELKNEEWKRKLALFGPQK